MSYGFLLRGSSGNVQIENASSGFSVVKKGVFPSSVSVSTINSEYSISNIEFMLVSPASGTGTLGFSNSTTFRCTSGNINYAVVRATKNVPQSSNSYGLRIKDADGSLVFDSGLYLAKPLSSVFVPKNGSYNNYIGPTTATLPSPIGARKRYVSFSFFGLLYRDPPNIHGGNNPYSCATWASQSSITFTSERVFDSRVGSTSNIKLTGNYAFILEL